jgi:2-polyprenyl-3-methyl-5-hydroxy-6-metoxy-1,4-benzoquinol methylase
MREMRLRAPDESPTLADELDRLWQRLRTLAPSAATLVDLRAHVLACRAAARREGYEWSQIESATDALLAEIWARSSEDPRAFRAIWDHIYARGDPPSEPNATLVDAIDGRPPGRALDVGMGAGRNAVFLASRGWRVTGFDIAEGAVRLAAARARDAGVRLHVLVASWDRFAFGHGQWDLIVVTYAHPLLGAFAEAIAKGLCRGGLLVCETVSATPLPDSLPGCRTLRSEVRYRESEWAPERQAASVVTLVAERL